MENIKMEVDKLKNRITGLRRKNMSGRGLSDNECSEYRNSLQKLVEYQRMLEESTASNTQEQVQKLVHTM